MHVGTKPADKIEFIIDGVTYTVFEEGKVEITVYVPVDNGTSVIIPQTVVFNDENYTVVKIGPNAFEGKTNLEAIDLPDTIQVIGARAFANCTNLKRMN